MKFKIKDLAKPIHAQQWRGHENPKIQVAGGQGGFDLVRQYRGLMRWRKAGVLKTTGQKVKPGDWITTYDQERYDVFERGFWITIDPEPVFPEDLVKLFKFAGYNVVVDYDDLNDEWVGHVLNVNHNVMFSCTFEEALEDAIAKVVEGYQAAYLEKFKSKPTPLAQALTKEQKKMRIHLPKTTTRGSSGGHECKENHNCEGEAQTEGQSCCKAKAEKAVGV